MKKILILVLSVFLFSCENSSSSNPSTINDFKVDFETLTLDNGLEVILHVDRSDPVVAVALTAHVGSAREKVGRTGFAHLFEHLLFLESENLGKGGLDKMSARIGGSGANGSTSRDRTNYFQTVPKDALEKMIWAEADKLGFFINTVTEAVLAKEKQVVKNEKRQVVDNRPYGHVPYVIGKNLYPTDHPYNWQVIGSLEDLQNATLEDVKEFFTRWYTPNNVTLTIAGDIDLAKTKQWVHKYFDEITRGEEVADVEKRTAVLSENKKLYYEDNFARLPQLTMTWPSVYQYHPDQYALEVLCEYLGSGKDAPLNKVLTDDKQVTSDIAFYNYNAEISGEIHLRIRAYEDKNLDEVLDGVLAAFEKFEEEGISEEDLSRIKAGQETSFYNGLSSVLGKGFQLAQYQIFTGEPSYINEDVQKILQVQAEDVKRVYDKYIKDKYYVATSFVPKGHAAKVLEGSTLAEVVEEKIIAGAEEDFDASIAATYEKSVSSFDRSVEPPYGEKPIVKIPSIWQEDFSNGLSIYGVTNKEVPLIQFLITVKSGLLLENENETGIANVLSEMLLRGTASKTTAELEKAIEKLGATVSVRSDKEKIIIRGSTLTRNFEKTMKLVEEVILQPRWDEAELALVKKGVISRLRQQSAVPNRIADNEFSRLIYGPGSKLSKNVLGTEKTVKGIEMEDLKTYYDSYIAPNSTAIHVTGDVDLRLAKLSLGSLAETWEPKEITFPAMSIPEMPESSKVYFYNVPDAKQSVLKFGYPAMQAKDDDYYPATVMNYRLGGGSFASQLTQELRESKGYTYGINSGFSPRPYKAPFTISSGVRSNVTLESAELIKEILSNYGEDYSTEDLEVTQSAMIKGAARAFETPFAKLNMLTNISLLGYPEDYTEIQGQIVENMTVEEIKRLAKKYVDPDKMIYLVVGDAKTQMEGLEKLGFGKPILLNELKN